MSDWRSTLLGPEATLDQTIQALDVSALQRCMVVDGDGKLLGTVTDGDIRRALLRRLPMDSTVKEAMRRNPVVANQSASSESLLGMMTDRQIRQIPLLDESGRVVGLAHIDTLLKKPAIQDAWVVLMAGGLGTRLRPRTESAPKPLLRIGGKPLLETIVENFARQGFRRFYISVNYKAEMIKDHFGDGQRWSVDIRYIEEQERMGTAGAMGLMPERPTGPLVVMNADLLTRVDFRSLLDYHNEHRSQATMCVREYDFQVPYGVVELDGHRFKAIQEKPVHKVFVNAGIYVLHPIVLDLIPRGKLFDMTTLFERVVEAGYETAVFPVQEYWLDIGKETDYERANGEYHRNFGEDETR